MSPVHEVKKKKEKVDHTYTKLLQKRGKNATKSQNLIVKLKETVT